MSYNLVSANNLSVANNLTVNGNILGSGTIQTTSNIQGANITTSGNINATNVNITGQLNSLTLNNLNSLDTTSSIQTALNNLQTKTTPLTYNSPNLGIFNTSPSYPLDVTANTFRVGNLVQQNTNGTISLINTNCASDPANFALYQGTAGDTVLNTGANQVLEFKVHNSQVAMLNSTGIGIGNGNPQHPLDVTGSINASTDLLINGNSVNNELNNLQTKTTPLTYNSPNLGIFNTSPSYPLDVTASTYRIGPVAQINSNGTFALVNTSCASDPANFCLYQGVLGDTVLNCGLNETIEFKVHNSQVAMLNSTGIGIGNGNPQHALDVTGSINASTDLLINGNSISPAISTINSLITIKAYGVVNYNSTAIGNPFSFGSSNNLQLTGSTQCVLGETTGTHFINLSSGVSGSLLQITILYDTLYYGFVALYSTNAQLTDFEGSPPVPVEKTYNFKITTFSNSGSYQLANCAFSFIVI